jgi:hypothetical protein
VSPVDECRTNRALHRVMPNIPEDVAEEGDEFTPSPVGAIMGPCPTSPARRRLP